jgi:hypothetical protein
MVVAEDAGECDHEKCCSHGGKQAQLENVPEERTDCRAAPEKGENERRHPEIGDSAEYRVVRLEKPEMPVGGGAQVPCDKILNKKRNPLDQEVYEGDEYAYFDIAENLEHMAKNKSFCFARHRGEFLYIWFPGKSQGEEIVPCLWIPSAFERCFRGIAVKRWNRGRCKWLFT